MANLYPTFDVPNLEVEEKKENTDKYSIYFDFEKGDFVQDNNGAIKEALPYDAWVQWCLKAVYTQRWSCLAYTDNTGVEIEQAMQETNRQAQESSVERTIRETLLADPLQRTTYVRDFEFKWGVDSLEVTFIVGGVWSRESSLTVKYDK